MKENRIIVTINRPITDVFEFTTNPKYTHLWFSSIKEEVAEEYPPKINTKYKNRGKGQDWNVYKVINFQINQSFELSDLNDNFSVKYTYKSLEDNKTEMEYFESIKNGELKELTTDSVFLNLKQLLEK